MSGLFSKFQRSGGKISKAITNSKGAIGTGMILLIVGGVVGGVALVTVGTTYRNVSNFNAGTLNDARLSSNVAKYDDLAPHFLNKVKAASFEGNLKGDVKGNLTGNVTGDVVGHVTGDVTGNADTATSLLFTPTGCAPGQFANSIDAQANLGCSFVGANLTNLNASNITSGTLSNARLTANVTLQGNAFNGANELVQLNGSGQLPAVSGANLTNLNASNITSGTLADARLTSNVAKYNDATPTFTNAVTAPTFNGNLNGNANTATALAADPGDCAADTYAQTIDEFGTLGCFSITNASTTATSSNIDDTIVLRGTNGDFSAGTISADLQGNADTASKLTPGSNINGVLFDGSADITITVDASTLTGDTLASNVVNSALQSVGTLTDLTVTNPINGDITGDAATLNGNDSSFFQDASNLNTGTIDDTLLSSNVPLLDVANAFTNANTFSNAGNSYTGDGSGLASVDAATLGGSDLATVQDAGNLTGTLSDSRLSGNVPLKDGTNTFTGANTFSNAGNSFTGTLTVTGGTIDGTTIGGVTPAAVDATSIVVWNSITGASGSTADFGDASLLKVPISGTTLTNNVSVCNVDGAITFDESHFYGCTGAVWTQLDNLP